MENVPSIRNDRTPEESIERIHKYLIGLKEEVEYSLQMLENEKDLSVKDLSDLFNSMSDDIEENSVYWDRIKDITNDLGKVITTKLEGDIRTSINKILNGTSTMVIDEVGILLMDKPTEEESSWAMRLGAQGFMIAGGKITNAELGTWSWDWKTFGTGDGFIADNITSGTLNAITLQACSILAANITSGTINGVSIYGSTIKIGDVAAGSYIEISPGNPVKVWKSGVVVASLGYSTAGGGKFVIYDGGGAEAFKVEIMSNGDLEMYVNSSSTYIPDPDHPGFWIPNPDSRKLKVTAGQVLFNTGAAGQIVGTNVSGDPLFSPFTPRTQVEALINGNDKIRDLNTRVSSIESTIMMLGTTYSKVGHTHNCSSAGTDSHTHRIT